MMVLADTSVWIAHWRKSDTAFAELLTSGAVLTHPFVIGELACGNLSNRAFVLRNLKELPRAVAATHDETLLLIDQRKLWARGIGWIDAYLLASALLSSCALWTLDRRLDEAAAECGVKRYQDVRG